MPTSAELVLRSGQLSSLTQQELNRRIVRGTQPAMEICKGPAAFCGVPLEDVLRLAGHMMPSISPAWPPELVALVWEVEDLPPPLRRAVIRARRELRRRPNGADAEATSPADATDPRPYN